ncbi:hypothetical protein [Calothrix sp. PCC 7507]|uniref:hypothetical protein n=1 Tax=Calothrix sp. PCC 7507 TaxID=99598 RepID=UPI00029F1C1F|nr:hypothetical protein [Calothrix sp. PCC 7507]AFY35607.1 hypothetical protein Cal7507_5268 [Calothrix sp. PCC 7507]
MKTETGHLPRLMNTRLRITSALVLCISIYVIVPKIVDSTENLTIVTTKSLSSANSKQLATPKANSGSVKDVYVPPNYGGPDSQNGSGTR